MAKSLRYYRVYDRDYWSFESSLLNWLSLALAVVIFGLTITLLFDDPWNLQSKLRQLFFRGNSFALRPRFELWRLPIWLAPPLGLFLGCGTLLFLFLISPLSELLRECLLNLFGDSIVVPFSRLWSGRFNQFLDSVIRRLLELAGLVFLLPRGSIGRLPSCHERNAAFRPIRVSSVYVKFGRFYHIRDRNSWIRSRLERVDESLLVNFQVTLELRWWNARHFWVVNIWGNRETLRVASLKHRVIVLLI